MNVIVSVPDIGFLALKFFSLISSLLSKCIFIKFRFAFAPSVQQYLTCKAKVLHQHNPTNCLYEG